MELLNLRLTFFLRKTYKNPSGEHPVVLRVIYRGERRDIFTGLFAAPSMIKKGLNENKRLIELKVLQDFNDLNREGPFTLDDLVKKIKGETEDPVLLIDYLEDALSNIKQRIGVHITKATFYKYRQLKEHFCSYLNAEGADRLLISRVSKDLLEKLFIYLRKEKNISHNTAERYFQLLKVMLTRPIKSGQIKSDPFDEFKLKREPTIVNYLTADEIRKIETAEVSRELERIRDIFLFGCYTGLAYADLRALRGENIIEDDDGSYFIRTFRQKTSIEFIIPLLPSAVKLLTKYSISGNPQDVNWYISSNQKMNKGLKAIGAKAGITKTLHMHLARHTFATTITLSNGIPLESVSHMLGHASIKQTQHYAKVVAMKVKADMKKIQDIRLS